MLSLDGIHAGEQYYHFRVNSITEDPVYFRRIEVESISKDTPMPWIYGVVVGRDGKRTDLVIGLSTAGTGIVPYRGAHYDGTPLQGTWNISNYLVPVKKPHCVRQRRIK